MNKTLKIDSLQVIMMKTGIKLITPYNTIYIPFNDWETIIKFYENNTNL